MSSSYGRNSRSGGWAMSSSGATCHHHRHRSSSPSPSHSYNSYYASSPPSASAFASSTTSSFGSLSRSASSFHHQHHSHSHHHHYSRPTSPIRVNLVGSVSSAPSVRFSLDSPSSSPSRSIASVHQHHQNRHHQQQQHSHSHSHHHHHNRIPQQQKRTCMCSPTTHPGSFRCSLHKNVGYQSGGHHSVNLAGPSNRLNARRSAMTNSLVRIGTVEGELVKRALASLIHPSSHQQRRRAAFQQRPSRLSIMSMAGDNDLDDV